MKENSISAMKVPEATLLFWLIKILSTTVGETGADFLAVNIGIGMEITSTIMLVLLILTLIMQVKTKYYIPAIYWLNVVLVSIVGTQITDILTDKLEVSLYLSTAFFSFALSLTFILWYFSEKTLSIQSITTRKRELFYWLTILFTFALGTAAGDLATEVLGLGFKIGVIIFSLLIFITGFAYRVGFNSVAAFWITYILTRPLGASLGDLLSQSKEYGGVGFGTIWTSLLFLTAIIFMVSFITIKKQHDFILERFKD